MKPVGLGVAGEGAIALQAVFEHIKVGDFADRVQVTAVCDPVPGRAQDVADNYGVPKAYTSYEEMLQDPNVDIVTLCTPIGLHYQQGMAAIEAGKSVHFNKTFSLTKEEADGLIEAADRKGVHLVASPGQMLWPANRVIRKTILEGKLGMPTWVIGGSEGVMFYHVEEPIRNAEQGKPAIAPEWYYKQPAGGPQYDCTVYALQGMTGVMGPAKRVTCFSGQMMPSFQFGDQEIISEVDDSTILLLDFGNALFGVVYSSLKGGICKSMMGPSVFGTKGEIVDNKINGVPICKDLMELRSLPHYTEGHEIHKSLPHPHVFEDVLQLVDWVREGKPSIASAEHARHVIEIIQAGYESARTGRVVELTTTFQPLTLEEIQAME